MNEQAKIINIIRSKKGIIFLSGLLVAALSFALLLTMEKNFKAGTKYLIIQDQSSQDFYSMSKSSEYIGKVMGEAIMSERFIDELVKTGKVNAEFLPFDKKEKLKEWANIVKVDRNSQLGIIEVTAFDNSQRQVMNISNGIAEVLTTKNNLFRGGSQPLEFRILSGPVLEKNPSLGNIAATAVGGFVLGMLLAIMIIYWKGNAKKEFMVFGSTPEEYKESLDFIEK